MRAHHGLLHLLVGHLLVGLVAVGDGQAARAAGDPADPPPRAAVLPLKRVAPVSQQEAETVVGRLRGALGDRKVAAVDPAVIRRLQEVMPKSCTTHACMERLADLVDAQLLVGGRVQREQSDSWTLQLWVYDRRNQHKAGPLRLATAQDRCRECGLPEVSRLGAGMLASLIERAQRQGATASLTVRSRPTGAVVRIDGTAMGVTDMTFGVTTGRHVVTLEKRGYRLAARTLELGARERGTFAATLEPTPSDRGGIRGHFGWLKWTVAGVAAATLGTGIALWATGRDKEDSGSGALDPEVRDYRTPGIALTVVGAALAGGAVALFVLDRPVLDRPVLDRPVPVSVSVGPGGGAVTYSARF